MKSSIRSLMACAFTSAAVSLSPILSYAQAPVSSATESAKPILRSELNKFLVVASINTCILSQEKVGFQTVVAANATSLLSLVSSVHGRRVQGENDSKPMTDQQLLQGLALQIADLSIQRCPKVIPEKDIAEVKRVFAELDKLDQKKIPVKEK